MSSKVAGLLITMIAVITPILIVSTYWQLTSFAPAMATDEAEPISAHGNPAAAVPPPPPPPARKSELPSVQELAPQSPSEMSDGKGPPLTLPEEIPPALEVPDGNGVGLAEVSPNTPASIENGIGGASGSTRLMIRREGTLLTEVLGTIAKKGPNLVFLPDDQSAPIALLQNQLLERVEQMEQARPRSGHPAKWLVSGRVTEYRGSNYLLLTSAVLKEVGK